jgi:hypothetical protein
MNLDLFGEGVYKPMTQIKSLLNVAHGFDEFWKCWPSGPRKVAKQQSLNRWCKSGFANNATFIIEYVEYLKTTEQWQNGFIPMPMTFLNRQGWIDWVPEVKIKKHDILEELKAHKGAPMPENIRLKISRILHKNVDPFHA